MCSTRAELLNEEAFLGHISGCLCFPLIMFLGLLLLWKALEENELMGNYKLLNCLLMVGGSRSKTQGS